MTTIKQGDLVKNEDGKTCKVLGVCGEVIHISYPYDHDIYEDTYTESFLKNQGYTWDIPAWSLKMVETIGLSAQAVKYASVNG